MPRPQLRRPPPPSVEDKLLAPLFAKTPHPPPPLCQTAAGRPGDGRCPHLPPPQSSKLWGEGCHDRGGCPIVLKQLNGATAAALSLVWWTAMWAFTIAII